MVYSAFSSLLSCCFALSWACWHALAWGQPLHEEQQDGLPFFLRIIAPSATEPTMRMQAIITAISIGVISPPYERRRFGVSALFILFATATRSILPLLFNMTIIKTIATTTSQMNVVHHHEPMVYTMLATR